MGLFDVVALKQDLPEHGLVRGSIGTIVELLDGGSAFEVEFCRDGKTVVSLGLREDQLFSPESAIRSVVEYFQEIVAPALFMVMENFIGGFVKNIMPVVKIWSRYVARQRTLQLWRERCTNSKVRVRDHYMLRQRSTYPGAGGKREAPSPRSPGGLRRWRSASVSLSAPSRTWSPPSRSW